MINHDAEAILIRNSHPTGSSISQIPLLPNVPCKLHDCADVDAKGALIIERSNGEPGLRTRSVRHSDSDGRRQALTVASQRVRRPFSTFCVDDSRGNTQMPACLIPETSHLRSTHRKPKLGCTLIFLTFLTLTNYAFAADPTPDSITQFTKQFCNSCHNATEEKGDFRIDTLQWALTETHTREQWSLVYDYVADGDMPPRKAKQHPDSESIKSFLSHLDASFAAADQSAKVGGTPVRRLNRIEYHNTVRDLFGIRNVKLPLSFPEDASSEEFDTMPAGLFLSPAVMDAYHETATNLADRLVPLPNYLRYSSRLTTETIGGDETRRWFGGKSKEYLQFTGFNHSGWVGGLWDSQFIAPSSGVYQVNLLANAQSKTGADGKPLRLAFYTFDPTEEQLPKRYRIDRATKVAEIEIPNGEPAWVECDVPVEAGETLHIYCANRLPNDAYQVSDQNRSQISGELKRLIKRKEPTVELRGMKIDGPVAVPPRVVEFFDEWPPKLSRSELERKLLPLAKRAFRRPLTDAESEKLIKSVLNHGQKVDKPEFAWHYAIRRLLCSPEFLYREAEGGDVLSDYALASRLSYFLWSTMPDQQLLDLAKSGSLSKSETLTAQTKRMLADPKAQQFIKQFTGQWLGNRDVKSINVCDNRYQWDDNIRYGFIRSTEMFFGEILRSNLPIATFIDSDFTYANSAMQAIWELNPKRDKNLGAVASRQRQSLVWPEPERISLLDDYPEKAAHIKARRGILGLPGVLTVTGDGVESSPILRGVWVLENLFGQHPPPPPKDVPALDIDTSKATNVRETLKAHTELESCAKCHRDIDPLGLSLENYDAIGGWRAKYTGKQGEVIDASSEMPDGTKLNGADSIRKHLLENREIFTRCLITKLLEYGAGRKLSVGDRQIVERLVETEPAEGYRFCDLIEATVKSEVFRAR